MPDVAVTIIAIAALTSSATAMALMIRIARRRRAAHAIRLVRTPEIGARVPDFRADRARAGGALSPADLLGAQSMIVFLGVGCPTCEQFGDDLELLSRGARLLDYNLFISVDGDAAHAEAMLARNRLERNWIVIDDDALLRLNPERAFPFYLLTDESAVVIASAVLGDANWSAFVEQVGDAVAMTSERRLDNDQAADAAAFHHA